MKKLKNSVCSALAVMCVFMFGAWTDAEQPRQDRYADAAVYSTYAVETVSFDRKETDEKSFNAPQYVSIDGLSNACGAVAGSEIVAYYDKYYANMIPDWQSYYAASGRYRKQDNVYIPNLMTQMYDLMRTNVDGVGVSDDDFVSGLTSYINGKGYTVSMQSVVSGSYFDYDACKTAIKNNKVIALLSRAVDVYTIIEGTTQDKLSPVTISDLHIMVASGYKEINYYRGNTLFRTDRYLVASSGLKETGLVFYKVNPHSLNKAYIVNIS